MTSGRVGRGRSDLCRVNFEVNDPKPFPHLAFAHSKGPKTPSKLPSFDGELMASFSDSAQSMVGIELGRVCLRRRATTLILSVARWVHNSAIATFPEAPRKCRTAEFPRSGLKPWPLVREPSPSPRGSSAGAHTPRLRMVCSQLSSISCVRLRSALCPTTALNMEPPSTQSPLCLMLALPPSGRREPPPARTLLPGHSSYRLIRQCAICKAVEKDCLTKGGEPIRPCVPSHVAYEVGRGGNDPSKALGQCTPHRKVGTGTVRQRCICQHRGGDGLGLIAAVRMHKRS